jgi:hypothetical protein
MTASERLSPPLSEEWQSRGEFRDLSFGQQATPAVNEAEHELLKEQLRSMEQALNRANEERIWAERERLTTEDFYTTQTAKFNESMILRNEELDKAKQQTAELVVTNTELEASYTNLEASHTELKASHTKLQASYTELHASYINIKDAALVLIEDCKKDNNATSACAMWTDTLQSVLILLCFMYTAFSLVDSGVGPYADAFVSRSTLRCFTVLANVTWFVWIAVRS